MQSKFRIRQQESTPMQAEMHICHAATVNRVENRTMKVPHNS